VACLYTSEASSLRTYITLEIPPMSSFFRVPLLSQPATSKTSVFTPRSQCVSSVSLKMSTTYHPEMDGSSECTNKTINQCLHYHVQRNQKGWVKSLPLVCFQIMNTVNASTGYSGFELWMGRSPRIIPPLVEPVAGSEPEEFHVAEIVERITTAVSEAKDNMLLVKVQQAYHANNWMMHMLWVIELCCPPCIGERHTCRKAITMWQSLCQGLMDLM
jgi:hypothetical protein